MSVRLGVWLLCVVASTAAAAPARVKIDLKNETALTKAGFTWSGSKKGQSTFAHGALVVRTDGFEEYWQKQAGFAADASNPPGWAVEARLRLDAPCDKLGPTIILSDGNASLRVQLTDHELVLYQPAFRADIGPTTTMRTYRIERATDALTISVDGKQVWSGKNAGGSGPPTLMFGLIGGACPDNRSTWQYIAYETTHVDPLPWPPREQWHPAVTAKALLDALAPALAVPKTVDRDDVPCIAIDALDSATRDLLPLAYEAVGEKSPAEDLRRLPVVLGPDAIRDAQRVLAQWTMPIRSPVCDPAPGIPCGPAPPPRTPAKVPEIEGVVESALAEANGWGDHPSNARRTVELVARAYVTASNAKVRGADAAAKRLASRLAGLAAHPPHCGL